MIDKIHSLTLSKTEAYNKKYRLAHLEETKAYNKMYRLKHLEEANEAVKAYNLAHPEKQKNCAKRYYSTHSEKEKARAKARYIAHPKEINERVKTQRKTPAGKEVQHRQRAKRRQLGFIPLNCFFDGAEAHHIDYEHVIFISMELHRSVSHDIWQNRNMDTINKIAFAFLRGEGVQQQMSFEMRAALFTLRKISDENLQC